MGLQPEKEKNDMGKPNIGARLQKSYFSKSAYIPQLIHKEIMEYAELCRGSSPDPNREQAFSRIPPHIQKVPGDLHYLLTKGPVNILWLSSLMNVNLISPEVFFFKLHLLKALKLHLYRTKAQWVNKEGT